MNNQLKILIVTPLYPPEIGGPATYTKFLEEHLPKGDFELDKVWFGEVKKLPYVIRHLALFWKIWRKAKDADIVYALDPLGVGLPAAYAAKWRKKRFFVRIAGDRAWETAQQKFGIMESLDTFSVSTNYKKPILLLKRSQTRCANMAEKIIVPSEYLKRVVSNWGIPKEKIAVVYNAFDPVEIAESKEELRRKFGFAGLVFVSAGRLVPWKGFEVLMKVMAEFPGAKLYIAGDGPQRVYLTRQGGSQVVFLGNISQSELLQRIKAADVFILNTFYEGFSHQLLEAMSAGTPVVSTDVGGNPELIENGKDGYLVEYNNKEQFVSALKGNIPMSISENAKEKLKQFSSERAISSFVKLID